MNMMLVPPKQRMRIHQFDAKTQEDAFTVSLEGLKGVRSIPYPFTFDATSFFLVAAITFRFSFTIAPLPLISLILLLSQWNVNALFLESAQAREDRKKRVRGLFSHPRLSWSDSSPPSLFDVFFIYTRFDTHHSAN